MVGGARGPGKSYCIVMDAAEHGRLYGKDARMIVFRENFPQLEDFLYNKCFKILPPLGWEYAVGRKTWIHPNGASLQLAFLESVRDALEYQGREFTWIALEELGIMSSLAAADLLLGCLRSAAGVPVRFLATANPGGPCHDFIKERYIDPAPPRTPFKCPKTGIWRVYINGTMKENPQLMENDPGYIHRLKGVGSERMVRAWIDGDWSISLKGEIFERDWFGWYDWEPEKILSRSPGYGTQIPLMNLLAQSWDTGCKTEEEHSKSAGLSWAASQNQIFITDMFAQRIQFPELDATVKSWGYKWHPHHIWVEDRSSGIPLIQMIKRGTKLPIKGVQATRDKESRAHAVSGLVEAGKVLLPSKAPWAYALIDELCAYPKKGPSDLVDAFTLGLQMISNVDEKKQKMNESRGSYRPRNNVYQR